MSTNIEIAIHLGAPHTDDEQLTWSLRKDMEMLAENGILLRRPKKYRQLLSDRIADLGGRASTAQGQEQFLASIIRQRDANRLILSGNKFLGVASWMLYGGRLYQNAGKNTARLRTLFPVKSCEFFLAIRNPASFIPAVFLGQNNKDYDAFFDGVDLRNIRWSDVFTDILAANPGCPITAWCNEDTPFIWPDVLHEITALDNSIRFAGDMDVVNDIISEEGVERLTEFMEKNPHLSELKRRKVNSVFLEYFVVEDSVEDEIDLPGWTEELVEELTEIYEADVEKIENMAGVNFISP